ncbi:MAG TPA: hypothetical protein H9673_07215 [Candidatus Adamsella sp.]|nr:hypothetical protein [Candidatus Adamsella sp.]
MTEYYLDAGTTWSKLLELDAEEQNLCLDAKYLIEKNKVFKDKNNKTRTGCLYLFPSKLLKNLDIKIDGATGHMVKNMLKDKSGYLNEILALAYGSKKKFGDCENRVILDIGSRDAKWIKFKNNKYQDLDWNGSCASATGATIEMLCKFYNINTDTLPDVDEKHSVTCGVFGMERIMDDIANDVSPEISISKYIHGIAYNMWNFTSREKEIYLSGGLCLNKCFIKHLEKYCKVHPLGRNMLILGLF